MRKLQYHQMTLATKYHLHEYLHLVVLRFMELGQEYYQKKVFQSHTHQLRHVVLATKIFLVVFAYLPVILGIDMI